MALMADGRLTDSPVAHSEGRLVGMLSRAAVREALEHGNRLGGLILAADLALVDRDPVTSEDSLLTALRRFGGRGVNVLPVVRRDDRTQLEGIVSHQDVHAGYERALTVERH